MMSDPEGSTAIVKHDPRVASFILPGFEGLVYARDTVATLEQENKDLRDRLARLKNLADLLSRLTVHPCRALGLKSMLITKCPTHIKAGDCRGCDERTNRLHSLLGARP